MAKSRIIDLVVILPGISGSVLQKDGRDLWNMSGQAAWRIISSMGKDLEQMVVVDDDPEEPLLADGITAPSVLQDVHMIPGLVKIDGYTALSRLITDNFEVIRGAIDDPSPANFFEFPYDWRRDNRASGLRLKELIDEKLATWRAYAGDDAQVILLAHSMGGLVSRHYLEVLEGWRDCRALVTFGTPHRGSVNAIDTLANGFKKLFLDLTEAMRSFKSVYQLMPIYEAVKVDDTYRRAAELEDLPGVNHELALDALQFHRDIEDAVKRHENEVEYLKNRYALIPVVGVHQKTYQSATFVDGKVEISRDLPAVVDELLDGGDGTVPRASATPIELSDEYMETFIAERHSSLQASPVILDDLRERIKQMQSSGHRAIRGPEITPDAEQQPAISLDLEDLYLEGEPVRIWAELINMAGAGSGLVARVEGVDTGQPPTEFKLLETDDGFGANLEGLAPGLHRIEVGTVTAGPSDPSPVHDVFEIMG